MEGSRRVGGRWIAGLGAVLSGLTLSGCDSGQSQRYSAPTVSAVQHPTLENIPFPSGSRLVDEQSFGVSSGRTRVGKFEFRTSLDRGTVSRFYKEMMPTAGFSLKKEDFDRGIYDMRFESASEECMVRLKPLNQRETTIVVHVLPLARGTAERERPLIPVRQQRGG